MNYLEDLRKRYIDKKERKEFTEEEIDFLDVFLKDDFCFLRVKSNEAIGIIGSLGVPKEQISNYYQNIFISMLKNMNSKQK